MSGLRGVAVEDLADSSEEVRSHFAKSFSAVIVIGVAHGVPAEASGIHRGDVIREMVTAGDDSPIRTTNKSKFANASANCVPDCLVEMIRLNGKRYSADTGYLHVGQSARNFIEIRDHSKHRLAFQDIRTAARWLSADTSLAVALERRDIRIGDIRTPVLDPIMVDPAFSVDRGEWSPTISYSANDVVTYAGYRYAASKANRGIPPAADEKTWELLKPMIPGLNYSEEAFRPSDGAGEPNHDSDTGTSFAPVAKSSLLNGVLVADLTAEQRQHLVSTKFKGLGVAVIDVPKGSTVERAGLRSGDVIVEIIQPDQHVAKLTNTSDFQVAAKSCMPNCLVHILYTRVSRGAGNLEQRERYTPAYLIVGQPDAHFEIVEGGLIFGHSPKLVTVYGESQGRPTRNLVEWDSEFSRLMSQGEREGLVKTVRTKDDCAWSNLESERQRCEHSFEAADVKQQIADIRRSSHQTMPPLQASVQALGGRTRIVIENATQYTLSVFLSGPISQKVEMAPGRSESLQLGPGNYEIAARVSDPSVMPFYGHQSFSQNMEYSERFYVSTTIR